LTMRFDLFRRKENNVGSLKFDSLKLLDFL